jgi:hypothetical protein
MALDAMVKNTTLQNPIMQSLGRLSNPASPMYRFLEQLARQGFITQKELQTEFERARKARQAADKQVWATHRMAPSGHDGFLKSVSVGFIPKSFSFSNELGRAGGIDFASCELLEVSIVPVPANSACVLHNITAEDGTPLLTPKKSQNSNATANLKRRVEVALIKARTQW